MDAATSGDLFQDLLDLRARTHLRRASWSVSFLLTRRRRSSTSSWRARASSARRTTATMLVVFDRLGEVVERAQLRRANRGLDVARGRSASPPAMKGGSP